jgi:hypothetical protein
MEPLLSRRQAVRPAVVGIIAAGLVGVVALSMLVGHSSTTELLQPGYIMLDDFQPWRVSSHTMAWIHAYTYAFMQTTALFCGVKWNVCARNKRF